MSNGIVGSAFHTFKTCPSGEHDRIDWQGVVLERRGDDYFVETFNWFDGASHSRHLIEYADMKSWQFYESIESMAHYYEHSYSMCECEATR